MRKRITSLLLTLVMLLSLVPAMGVTASAAEPEWTTVKTFDELKEAMQQGTKTNIKLGKDINTNDEENHKYGLTTYNEIQVRNTITLDLNGKKLTLNSGNNRVSCYIRIVAGKLTVQDSGDGGEIYLNDEYDGGSSLIQVEPIGTFTLKSGTIRATTPKPRANGIKMILNFGTVNIEGGTLTCTQKDGSVNANGHLDAWSSCYALLSREDSKSVQTTISGGTFTGYVEIGVNNGKNNKITGGTFNNDTIFKLNDEKNMTWTAPGLTISGGTFKVKTTLYGMCYHEKSTDIAAIISGGTFDNLQIDDGKFYHGVWVVDYKLLVQTSDNGKDLSKGTFKQGYLPCQLLGGTYGRLFLGGGTTSGYRSFLECVHEGFRSLLSNGGIKVGNTFYPFFDIDKAIFEKGKYGGFLVVNPNNETITVIPDVAMWGVKSVTLDGEPIDYAKDWTGEWKRVGNNKDRTLVFEWYPLSSDMIKAGYTYDAKYLLYRTNSSDEPTPITVDTSKNTLELKINKGELPGGYSYDFRLDLQKNGVDLLGSSTNQHIVMLVVYPAQVETKAITAVNLTVPELNAGAKAGSAVTLTASTPADSCAAGTTTWNIPASGAEQSATYYATVTLTAQDGYAFGSGTAVKLTGDHVSQTASISGDGKTMTVRIGVAAKHVHEFGPWIKVDDIYHKHTCSCTYSEQKTHKWVVDEEKSTITNTFYKCSDCGAAGGVSTNSKVVDQLFIGITHPIDGDLPDGDPSRWAEIHGPASCMDNASIKSVRWYELDGTTLVTRFEAGKRYSVSITFEAHAGYQFVESDNFNTQAPDFEVGTMTRSDNGAEMTVVYTLLEEKPVQKLVEVKVKLPSLNDKIGQAFPAGELVGAPAGITLEDGFVVNGDSVGNDSKVQPDKKYLYVATVNSANPLDSVSVVIDDEGDAVAAGASGGIIIANYHTPDPNKITSVALTITAPKYGEAPATTATGDNDALYTVSTPKWSPADAAFDEKDYTVSIPVPAVGSYSFADNCLYTINGYMADVTKNADGSVTLSYAFPTLTAPHTHNYTGQPWHYLDPGNHYQECTENDGGYNIQPHAFTNWTDNGNDTHSRHCTDCKMADGSTYTETAEHTWVWVVDQEAALNQPGLQHEECTGCHAKRNENTEIPALRDYAVTVTGGTATVAAGTPITRAMEGVEVTVTAQAPAGKHFVKWVVKAGGVTLANETSATTTFIMPATDVKIEANFEKNGSTGGGGGGGVTTYAITVKSAKNGDVTASHKSASKGTTVTLTVDPDKGYVLDTLTVLDGKDKEIKLTEKKGKYTFTMPASKVTVKATFKAAGNNPFTDVPAGSYYEDAVIWAVDKGITTGTSATTFNPNGICTRAQAVTFLWRAAGSPAAKSSTMPFADVKAGSYYYDAVLWAVEQGITKGTSDTMFSPDATCTRAQIVTFLWRANGSPAVSGNSAFTDVASDAYYAAAVTWAEKNDVTGGIGGGLFGSNNNCTRAQIVTFIYRSVK